MTTPFQDKIYDIVKNPLRGNSCTSIQWNREPNLPTNLLMSRMINPILGQILSLGQRIMMTEDGAAAMHRSPIKVLIELKNKLHISPLDTHSNMPNKTRVFKTI